MWFHHGLVILWKLNHSWIVDMKIKDVWCVLPESRLHHCWGRPSPIRWTRVPGLSMLVPTPAALVQQQLQQVHEELYIHKCVFCTYYIVHILIHIPGRTGLRIQYCVYFRWQCTTYTIDPWKRTDHCFAEMWSDSWIGLTLTLPESKMNHFQLAAACCSSVSSSVPLWDGEVWFKWLRETWCVWTSGCPAG